MKKLKWITGALLALSLLLSLAIPAFAAEDYTYTVNLSGGLYGNVEGSETLTFEYNEQWNPNDYPVQVTNPKYYFKGYHISGREGVVGATDITKDTVFVATYGIRGNMVGYKVNYQDAAGKTIEESRTFYGSVGDKPVVAYPYIEGYQPQAYNLTKTLVENEAENEFTFVYKAVEKKKDKNSGKTRTKSVKAKNANAGEQPVQLLDLDNPAQTADAAAAEPAAAVGGEGGSTGPNPIWIAGIALLALAAAVCGWLVIRKRGRKDA